MFDNGDGVDQNFERAHKLYRKACDHRDSAACFNLGLMFEQARGVERDMVRARELYRKACKLGSPDGCHSLAALLDRGLGGERNLTRARTLYERACNGGLMWGCFNLGYFYEVGRDGRGVDVSNVDLGNRGRRLTISTTRALDEQDLDLCFDTLPTGTNGQEVTYWAATLGCR